MRVYLSFRPLSGYLISKFARSSSVADGSAVSVPSRGILFPNEKKAYKAYAECSFRPLSGYLISKYWDNKYWENRKIVSVPSRGILFPNFITGVCCSESDIALFPSPLGVSYFQIMVNWLELIEEKEDQIVSVPSRGILFPNNLKKVHRA